MQIPDNPKIYHIVHIDRLQSIVEDGYLYCDTEVSRRGSQGTEIGMKSVKQRRTELPLLSHDKLSVGDCVPFYFCPRSVMLYVIHMRNHPELGFYGGQSQIVHLQADLRRTVDWAEKCNIRWAFTNVNAGASYCEDWCSLDQLSEINWDAVKATDWRECKEAKQAEFLIEKHFPWNLVTQIGVRSRTSVNLTRNALANAVHRPHVEFRPNWYY